MVNGAGVAPGVVAVVDGVAGLAIERLVEDLQTKMDLVP